MRPLFHAALPRVLLKERGSGASRVSVYNMKKIGFIGWRGMVGSVLMNRMVEEHDFVGFESHFFSTSQAGQKAPEFAGTDCGVLLDAGNLDLLKEMDIIVTCQGGGYTTSVYDKLLASGWKGYWIDSASTLRQDPRACIIAPSSGCRCRATRPRQAPAPRTCASSLPRWAPFTAHAPRI